MPLTDTACRNAQPREKPYKLADAKGLFLLVTSTGFKSWRWKYRFDGKEKLLTFGSYPEIRLSAARSMRESSAAILASGQDPGAVRKAAAVARQIEASNTFETIGRRWHELKKSGWVPVHAADVLSSLEKDVFPKIGSRPISSITARDVLEVLRPIEDRPAIETAKRVRQRISQIFQFAIVEELASADPAAGLQVALKPLIKRRQPAFRSLKEARSLLEKVEAEPAHPLTKLASRLLALTALRPGVIRTTPWTEIDSIDSQRPAWRIPAERMKLVVEHKGDASFDFVVPLARQSIEVLETARLLSGKGPFVFPNERFGNRPMSENAIGYMYNRHGFRGRHVPHGWRATFSTIMNELAIEREMPGDRAVIDLMLAHIPQGVEGAYNRAAYMKRRREIAQEWADMLLADFPPASELLKGPKR